MSPKTTVKMHKVLTYVWGALAIPTLLFWTQSIPWIVFMSLYANFVGHWSAYTAAKAERQAEKNGES
jgi:hypothetical protein